MSTLSTRCLGYIWLPLLAAVALAQAPSPLEVVSYSSTQAKLFNSSQKTVVATVIGVSCNGGTAYILDDYRHTGSTDPTGSIRPGDTAERNLPCSPTSKDDIRVAAVVYEDNTAEGDSAFIAQVFTSRQRFIDTIKAERATLNAAPDTQTAIMNLRGLKSNRAVDQSLIAATVLNLKEHQGHKGSYEDFKSVRLAEIDREIRASEANVRRAQ